MTFTSGLPPAGAPVSGMPTPVPVVVSGPGYSTVCPGCGSQLSPVVLDPDSAPWLCPSVCARGWWVSELSAAARVGWDHRTCSFQWSVLRGTVAPARVAEWLAAQARGTSALPEQLPLLDAAQLSNLLTFLKGVRANGTAAFVAQVEAALAARTRAPVTQAVT